VEDLCNFICLDSVIEGPFSRSLCDDHFMQSFRLIDTSLFKCAAYCCNISES
jgi:hypothetical protein